MIQNSEVIRENVMNILYDTGVWKDFLNQIPVVQDRRPTTDKWGYKILKISSQQTKQLIKLTACIKGEQSYTSDWELISKIDNKELDNTKQPETKPNP